MLTPNVISAKAPITAMFGQSTSYLFRGAVKGVVIRQVQVLPEELMVHLGSYGADVMGNRYG